MTSGTKLVRPRAPASRAGTEADGAAAPGNRKPRVRRPDEVRQRVLTAALHAFATSGFEGASMRAIAKDAQVSQSLLLYHFTSKDELWRAVLNQVSSRCNIGELTKGGPDGATAGQQLDRVIRALVTGFSQVPELHRLMTLEASQPSERLSWMIDRFNKRDFDFLCALIEQAQAEGAVRRISPERMRFAIYAMAAVPFSVSAEYQHLTRRNPFSAIEIEATIDMIHAMVFV